jgi:molecular chaperone GrpE
MRPFDDERHDSGVRPVAPEHQAVDGGPELEPSVPAGEPEAPVGPAGPSAAEDPAEHEQQLERDLDELAAKAQKADEYLELAKRTRADFENYRKRAARDAAAAQERGVVKLVRELLPAVDNLDRALAAVAANGESTDEVVSGIKLVHAEVIAALNRAGVELYSPDGERFDPTRHEAVAQQAFEGAEPGTVVEVYQRGCRLGDSVIRPARVVVAG